MPTNDEALFVPIDDIDILSIIQVEIKKIKSENDNISKRINEITLSMFDLEDDYNNKQTLLENYRRFESSIDLIDDIETKRNLITNFIEYFTYDSDTNEVGYKIRL